MCNDMSLRAVSSCAVASYVKVYSTLIGYAASVITLVAITGEIKMTTKAFAAAATILANKSCG